MRVAVIEFACQETNYMLKLIWMRSRQIPIVAKLGISADTRGARLERPFSFLAKTQLS
jgi:hypothetical protein